MPETLGTIDDSSKNFQKLLLGAEKNALETFLNLDETEQRKSTLDEYGAQISIDDLSELQPQIYRFLTAHSFKWDFEGAYNKAKREFESIQREVQHASGKQSQLFELWLLASQHKLGILILGENAEVLRNHAVDFSF